MPFYAMNCECMHDAVICVVFLLAWCFRQVFPLVLRHHLPTTTWYSIHYHYSIAVLATARINN
jgi:hypothetical protein